MSENTNPSITFFSKKPVTCPLCATVFQREELQTGRGRLNAGELTNELRRLYIPTQKYGVVNPLLYPVLVCPKCLFAGLLSDFQKAIEDPHASTEASNRALALKKLFGKSLDFTQTRDLMTGLASYVLGFMSTTHLERNASPTARRGLYALRAAWLTGDIYEESSIGHFSNLKSELYRQALHNYESALEKQLKNIEPFDGFIWMGPDVDVNFGYDGVIYIISMMNYKQLNLVGQHDRVKKLETIKRHLSRIFGIGKSNRDKPEILVNYTKELYAKINEDLKRMEASGIDISSAMNIEGLDNV